MGRRSSVSATYQPCPGEAFVVEVTAHDGYPDALDEARTQAIRGVTELMAAAQAVWPHETAEVGDDD